MVNNGCISAAFATGSPVFPMRRLIVSASAASLREGFAMQKLSILAICLLVLLACMTAFICLSGAFTLRDTEYGSGTAAFCYIEGYVC